jgi:CSLREA domain-containing protein
MNRIAKAAAIGIGIALSGALSALTPGPTLAERRALPTDAQDPAAEGLRPLSLASADFDGDGIADLAAGYADAGGGGRIVLFRGNPDALYPWSPEARRRRAEGRFVEEPFLPTGLDLALPAPPDLLLAGDFDADGRADLAAAALGAASLLFVRGDGRGRLDAATPIALPGSVTAVGAGEMNRRDGLTDLVVSLVSGGSARALVLSGPDGALRAQGARSFDLPAPASSIAVGDADGDGLGDFAAVSGAELLLLSGRGASSTKSSGGRVPLDFAPRAAAILPGGGIALEAEDGGSRTLVRRTSDTGEPAWQWSGDPGEPASRRLSASLAMRVTADASPGRVGFDESGALSVLAPVSAATFVVNSTADTSDATPGDGVCAAAGGECSLRAAIQEANAHAGADTISFAIPGGGVPQISTPALPSITETLTVDGTTQAAGKVMVTGTSNGTVITLAAAGCALRGIVLNGTGNNGLKIQGDANVVEGSFFGTTADGTAVQGGIFGPDVNVSAGANNLIGGTAVASRNVIAGGTYGVFIGSGGTAVQGNYIGTDVTGTVDLGSSTQGVRVFTGDGNTIGGTAAGAGNLISGEGHAGIELDSNGNLVQGNRIGTDATGTGALSNAEFGIHVYFSDDNTIGGTAAGAGNLVSGNVAGGIRLDADGVHPITNTIVQGNRIGTDAGGTTALPNQGHGIYVVAGTNVQIGGASAGARNLVSGNLQNGIFVTKFSTVYPENMHVQGNYIGTDATGTIAIPNVQNGIEFEYCHTSVVGGSGPGEGNVISGNDEHGVRFDGGDASAFPNLVLGNLIGTNALGTGGLGNVKAGVYYNLSARGFDAGGAAPGEANVIAYNGGAGIASGAGRPVRFRPNVIHSNGGLGVDRGSDGVTPNQTPGTFVYENFPVLTSAATSPSGTTVSGTLASGYALAYTLHFFANPTCDVSSYGEARQYLGSLGVSTTAGADTPFTASLPALAAAGSYITALAVAPDDATDLGAASELSFCRLVTGDPGPPPNPPPLSLSVIAPATGGNTGSVSVTISGESIDPAATVRLTRAGEVDVPGEYVRVGAGGGNLGVMFNLAGRAIGDWDVVVSNPGGATATIPNGFAIVAGSRPELWVDLVGRTKILRGRDTRFYIVFGNRGNVDALFAPVILTGIPQDAIVQILSPIAPMPQLPGEPPIDYSTVPVVNVTSTDKQVPLLIPVIAAQSTHVFAISIKTQEPAFELTVSIGAPWAATLPGVPLAAGGLMLAPGATDADFANCLGQIVKTVASELLGLLLKQALPTDCVAAVVDVFANQLPNFFANMLSAGQSSAGFQTNISLGQAAVQLGSIVINHADCIKNFIPAAKLVSLGLNIAKTVAFIYSAENIYNACKDFFPTSWKRNPILSVIASDPNEKWGSDGLGAEHWISGAEPSRYAILFENEPAATAPAHDVVVTDTIDLSKFDPATFAFGPIGVGAGSLDVSSGPAGFTTDVDLRPDRNVVLRVSGSLDASTGLAEWHFISLDPATGLPSEDPDQGFLPPDVAPPEGEASVSFTIEPRDGFSSGTQLHNGASIVFDTNAPIDTAVWLNTLDAAAPASAVDAMPASSPCSAVAVSWSGSDAGSGIAEYDVYVSEDGGAYAAWQPHATWSSGTYFATPGSSVRFYSVARDLVGNEEPAPASADATTIAGGVSAAADGLAPFSGPAGGVPGVTVTGSGFEAGLGLSFGGLPAASVSVMDSHTATAAVPALIPGAFYDLAATNPSGCGSTLAKAWFADFLDVPAADIFHDYVENLVYNGITAGCGAGNYCSSDSVKRKQMAVFILKSKLGGTHVPPAATGTVFGDVPASDPFAPWIEELAGLGITGGCGGGNYCPESPVRRDQMAVFLLKGRNGSTYEPPPCTGIFPDVPCSPNPAFAAAWIEKLAADGVTGGCGGGNYCPASPVTRGQMAAFLAKTFGF